MPPDCQISLDQHFAVNVCPIYVCIEYSKSLFKKLTSFLIARNPFYVLKIGFQVNFCNHFPFCFLYV